jgi:hypothetical protein
MQQHPLRSIQAAKMVPTGAQGGFSIGFAPAFGAEDFC